MRSVACALTLLGISCSLVTSAASTACADPVRVTIDFAVLGDPDDPDFGDAVASGSFSLLTDIAAGRAYTNMAGFNADAVSFSWAGGTWAGAGSADVISFGFDTSGSVSVWTLGGALAGFALPHPTAWPDFYVSYCAFCLGENRRQFTYTTARSGQFGPFTGQLSAFTATVQGTPVPEPASWVLIGSGLLGLVRRARAL